MDTSQRKSLLCLELKSIAIGYRALQIVSAEAEILDASPAGDRFLILATGDATKLDAVRDRVRSTVETDQLLDSEVIADGAPSLLEAFFHLSQAQADESLLVVDCASVSGLVGVANSILNTDGLLAIELKIKRFGGGAYGFFTGPTRVCAPAGEEARTKLKRAMRDGQVEVIDELNANFRRFFNLDGQD